MEAFVDTAFAPLRDIVRLVRGDAYGYESNPAFAGVLLVLLAFALIALASWFAAGRDERRQLERERWADEIIEKAAGQR